MDGMLTRTAKTFSTVISRGLSKKEFEGLKVEDTEALFVEWSVDFDSGPPQSLERLTWIANPLSFLKSLLPQWRHCTCSFTFK